MELRRLKYFVAVAEELHFRRAAERLHIAQPAVSEQIRKLERELGVQLFERHQKVSLTSAGEALLPEARHVLRQVDLAIAASRNANDDGATRMRIGYLPDSLPRNVPRALRQLAAAAPRVAVEFEPGTPAALIENLRAGRLDVALVNLPVAATGMRVTELGHQRAVVALPAGHSHAVRPAVALDWITRERLLVLPRELDPPFHDALVALARHVGIALDLIELADAEPGHALLAVAAGAGLALVPESVAERFSPPGVRFVALEGSGAALRCAALTDPAAESLSVRAFLHALRRTTGPIREAAQAIAA
jgi:DNA-binding transcriptional LysR family regulator